MANNYFVKDATGTTITIESDEDTPGIQTPVHHVKTLPVDPLGASADTAVTGDNSGTISAKLRGLIKWAYGNMPASLGQKTKANSLPVCLASDTDTFSFGASENELGYVNENLISIVLTPTITASSAYAAGACVGGLMTFTNAARKAAGSGKVINSLLADKSIQNASLLLLLFDANPTSSTFTDNLNAVLDPGDLSKLIGAISIDSEGYMTIASRSFFQKETELVFALASSSSIYGALILKESSPLPTYATTGDLVVKLSIKQN